MRMYITEKDNATLKFIEQFGSATINQISKLFYNEQVYAQQYAAKKLSKLVKYKKIKCSHGSQGNQNVYYMDKKLSYHDLLCLDYYCKLVELKANIISFIQEPQWMNNTYFSDAYCCYSIENKLYFDIIEVVASHRYDKNKYIDIYNSGEIQNYNNLIYKKLGGQQDINKFPRIILIDNIKHTEDYLYINDDIKVFQLDFKLNNFLSILV